MSLRLSELQTPCLVADRQRLAANAQRMRDRICDFACDRRVTLRPHVKTTKCVEMATIAHGGVAGPITVSTLREAEYFARAGFTDVTYAVGLTPNKHARAAAIAEAGVDLQLLISTLPGALDLVAYAMDRARPLRVMLEVDCGEHRTGFFPGDSALTAAATAIDRCSGLQLVGLLTHGGHSYQGRTPADFAAVAEEERRSLLAARDGLDVAGAAELLLSSGSTPTARFGEDFSGIDEIRPGVYLTGDLFQAQLGTVAMDDIAISVLTCVIAHDPERNALTIDAGGLALSKDRSTAATSVDQGYGVVVRADGRRFAQDPIVTDVHQEHGRVSGAGELPYDELPIGSVVRVLPNHACMTAAAYDRYYVVEGTTAIVSDEWEKVAGW